MIGHTPGPWTLETVKTSVGWCHKIGPFPWKNGKENHACVYDDYASGHNGTPELIANARLIAAAPCLLEALRILVGCAYPVSTEIDPRGHAWCEAYLDQALDLARTAIAIAKGETA